MRLKSRITCTFTHTCYFCSESTHPHTSTHFHLQIHPKLFYSYPRENSQKQYPIPVIPHEINAQDILVTTTCHIISGDECSKKKKKKRIRGNKKGQVPGTSDKRKSETRGKNGQVSDSRIRGTRYPSERKRKRKYRVSHSPRKASKCKKGMCPLKKSESRIRFSPLLLPSSPYTIHSPHMHILI